MSRPRSNTPAAARSSPAPALADAAAPTRRSTPQNDSILRVLTEARRPLSPAEILSLAKRRVKSLGQATVYRAIARLLEGGEIVPVQLPGQPPRYETKRAAETHHHHFHCDSCGRVFDVPGCPAGLDRLAPEGFAVRRHEVVLYGECSGCGDRSR